MENKNQVKILVSLGEFIKNIDDFVLIYALDASQYNFMEVVRRLRIEDEVSMFFGKTLDKYTYIDKFEFIIQDIIAGTPVWKYEELLMKMHKSFVFPDHLLIINSANIDSGVSVELRSIFADRLLYNSSYWSKGPGMPGTQRQITVTATDFCSGKDGLYCFVLLHRDDYSSLDSGAVSKAFSEAVRFDIPGQ